MFEEVSAHCQKDIGYRVNTGLSTNPMKGNHLHEAQAKDEPNTRLRLGQPLEGNRNHS